MSVAAESFRLEILGDAFVQPRRTTPCRQLRDKRVRKFMFQNMSEFRGHHAEATDRDAQLTVIHRSGPTRSMGHVEKGLLGIERYQDVVAGRRAEIANEIVVIGFQS